MKKYQKPFKVKNGIIYDANNCVVKLWGVNYYAPFNHNYQNLIELGIDIYKAIEKWSQDIDVNDEASQKMLGGLSKLKSNEASRLSDLGDESGLVIENITRYMK